MSDIERLAGGGVLIPIDRLPAAVRHYLWVHAPDMLDCVMNGQALEYSLRADGVVVAIVDAPQ